MYLYLFYCSKGTAYQALSGLSAPFPNVCDTHYKIFVWCANADHALWAAWRQRADNTQS